MLQVSCNCKHISTPPAALSRHKNGTTPNRSPAKALRQKSRVPVLFDKNDNCTIQQTNKKTLLIVLGGKSMS